MKLPDSIYDRLKWIALILLPAISTVYSALSAIWDLPCAEQIPASITAISLFLGSILGISTAEYRKNNTVNVKE